MKKYYSSNRYSLLLNSLLLIVAAVFLVSCSDDDPVKENTPELITRATLTFTPAGGGAAVVVTATDPDGEGVQDIEVDGPINLAPDKTYALSIQMINALANPSDPEYNITDEVEEEGHEHMFFFAWTGDVFSDPLGNGNIDSRADAVNYEDEDVNGLPIGLNTSWTSAVSEVSGTFRILLKHQPALKSTTSGSDAGESDLDITFTINVQ